MNKLILLFTITRFLSNAFNLAGNTYYANFKVPLLSKTQNMKLYFINNQKAYLKLNGFINSQGNVYYHYDRIKHLFIYTPDQNIAHIMKKYLVSLYDITYDENADTPILIIKSKLFRFKQKITFNNVNSL